jgi:SAM-dependent methyltransferase
MILDMMTSGPLPEDRTAMPAPIVAGAGPADLDEIRTLLREAGLSDEGVDQCLGGFLVAREGARLIATACLEDCGTAGLLRSVAVASDLQESGLRIIGGHGPRDRQGRRKGGMIMEEQAIRTAVRERYGRLAAGGGSCASEASGVAAAGAQIASCCGGASAAVAAVSSCCGEVPLTFLDGRAVPQDLAGASLGCGAPIDAAVLQPGETVVDLGSGAGLDIFFAADRVGPAGRAIGVDMTPEMIAKARTNASRLGARNTEFRLGEIEHLPLPDASADVIISNCVINLLPDKRPAFAEAFRVLRPGGRMVISDIVSDRPLPEEFKTAENWTACLAGAIPQTEYLSLVTAVGFKDVEVLTTRAYGADLFSITLRAVKPRAN